MISNDFYPNHGFFDCTAMYQGDEVRKYVDILAPFCIWTAQEGTEGGSGKIPSLRQRYIQEILAMRPDGSQTSIRNCYKAGTSVWIPPI